MELEYAMQGFWILTMMRYIAACTHCQLSEKHLLVLRELIVAQ
jgi:hypothetical protein